jgi:hypothetical protein
MTKANVWVSIMLCELWPDKPLSQVTDGNMAAIALALVDRFGISEEQAAAEVAAYYCDIEAEGLGHITMDDLDDGYGED